MRKTYFLYLVFTILVSTPTLAAEELDDLMIPWGGGFVHFSYGDEVKLHRSFRTTRLHADAPFPIASLSKQMTAYLAHKMIRARHLQIETRVDEVFPDAVDSPSQVKHLLVHRSGINDDDFTRTELESYGNYNCPDLNRFAHLRPTAEPRYSNVGYCVLARILEHRTDRPFAELLKEEVFEPLGMHSTYSAEVNKTYPSLRGLSPIVGGPDRILTALPQNYFGSAGIVTTPNDLARWKDALSEGDFLAKERLASIKKELKARLKSTGRSGEIYEWGLRFNLFHGYLEVSHIGKIEGHTSFLAYYPELDLFFFILLDYWTEDVIESQGRYFLSKVLKAFPE